MSAWWHFLAYGKFLGEMPAAVAFAWFSEGVSFGGSTLDLRRLAPAFFFFCLARRFGGASSFSLARLCQRLRFCLGVSVCGDSPAGVWSAGQTR